MAHNKLWSMHCLNYNNPVRHTSMTARFNAVGITDFTMYPGVPLSDPRINPSDQANVQRCHSCMWGHLDMISNFLNNDGSKYGIFCEDDILLDANFMNNINTVIADFEKQSLDVLLLGYLVTYVIEDAPQYQNGSYRYYDYGMESIWGTQMYMLSRAQARRIVNKYTCLEAPTMYDPFSADWTITKEGNRRIVYPMLAIEDGKSTYDHAGQAHFHALSHSAHLKSATYV